MFRKFEQVVFLKEPLQLSRNLKILKSCSLLLQKKKKITGNSFDVHFGYVFFSDIQSSKIVWFGLAYRIFSVVLFYF
jgi:hypothetical protein